jgi:hypothetical protein
VAGCANITKGVVKDEVFKMDKLAVDPQRAQASAKFWRSGKPAPTGERAIRSSRRVRATAASKAGRIRAVMVLFARS